MRTAPAHASAARGREWLMRLKRFAAVLVQPQVSSAARERRDTFALLLAVALVVVPHFEHLPLWATGLVALMWLWRVWLTLAQRPVPSRLAVLPLLLVAAFGVWLEHRTLLGRDAGVTFLLLLMGLKLLEMRARRDVFVVIFLAFFVLLTQFLFGQGLLIAALTLLTVLLLFSVLASVNLTESDLAAGHKIKLVGIIALKAVPLTLVLFYLFPRLSGPLWGMPGQAAGGRTGLSDTMTPGAFTRLLQSDEIAFRVRFDGPVPGVDRLYWRGPVLGLFNGRSWRHLPDPDPAAEQIDFRIDPASEVSYTVTLEPHQRDWLFVLEMPDPVTGLQGLGARLTADGQLIAGRLIGDRIRYTARSYTVFALDAAQQRKAMSAWLQLPPGYNPRTARFAAELRDRLAAGGITQVGAQHLIPAVLDHLRNGGYGYTVEPPPLGRHAIDELLFDTKRGFCEHYSAAFVVLMRMFDIPARIVTGYQGGEVNPVDGFMTVRQSDAHAWAEVWIEGRGWRRVDPTAVVTPVRGQRSGELTAVQREGALIQAGDRAVSWMRAMRLNWEAIENSWNQWILSYSQERQLALLEKLGFTSDQRTLMVIFALAVSLVVAVLGIASLRHRVERDPLADLFARFRLQLERAGLMVPAFAGPRALKTQLQRELTPASQADAAAILHAFERWRYSRASASVSSDSVRALKKRVRAFKPRLRD